MSVPNMLLKDIGQRGGRHELVLRLGFPCLYSHRARRWSCPSNGRSRTPVSVALAHLTCERGALCAEVRPTRVQPRLHNEPQPVRQAARRAWHLDRVAKGTTGIGVHRPELLA